jgi:hypothetical protein
MFFCRSPSEPNGQQNSPRTWRRIHARNLPAAPLMVGDYGITALITEFANFSSAKSVLEQARIPGTGHVNLEDLLTRLMAL